MPSPRKLLVLGATSGIGKAFHAVQEPNEFWDSVHGYGVEDFDVVQRMVFRSVLEEIRPTDIVYSVGINRLNWIKDVSPMEFSEVMSANIYGFLNMIRLLDELVITPVNIVAVTSDAAWRPMRTSAIYCASKAALEMCIRVASREYATLGWRINGVAPGKVADTAMTEYVDQRVLELRGWSPEFAENYERQSTPIGRKVTKEEVAQVIEQVLFGPAAQTGEIIAVNGGR